MAANFPGPEYDSELDFERLTLAKEKILALMLDGEWRTVERVSLLTRVPQNSAQAQLRHLRKPRHGGYIVETRTGEITS